MAADSKAINVAAAKAQQAGAKAQSRASLTACNKARFRYAAWRACWHGLLEPVTKGLTALATTFGTLAGRDFPQACISSLGKAQETFNGFVPKVDKLLAGIDSEHRAARATAMNTYDKTFVSITKGYTKPFVDLTQVCYSPKDLASINATPSASPSKAP